MRFGLAVLGAILAAACPSSAATYSWSLEEAVDWGLRKSPSAQRLQLLETTADLAARERSRSLWPTLSLDLRAPIWTQDFNVEALPGSKIDTVQTGGGEPLLVTRQVFGKVTTTRANAAGDLRLQQLLPWRGRLAGSGSVYYRDEETSPVGLRASRRDYSLDASVGLDIPLLGDDPDRRAQRRADHEARVAEQRAQAARAELEFDIVSRYLALQRARLSLEIVRAATEQSKRALDVARQKVRAGLLAEVEEMRMDVSRSEREARLAEAEAELARAGDGFKVFLGLALSDSLELRHDLRPFDFALPMDDAARAALSRRQEVGLAEREVDLLERDRRAQRPYVPDVDLALRYGGGASERLLDQALESISANNLSFLVTLRVPLWDAGRGSIESSRRRAAIALRRIEVEEMRGRIELEVRDAVRQMQDARRRYDLFVASSTMADELLRIDTERFDRGLIDAQAYLTAQSDAAAARLGRTQALLDLYQARARLRLVTLQEEVP